MLVQRSWKRDGSTNRMEMQVACENIKEFAICKDIQKESVLTIRKRLARGETLETKHAFFSVAWRANGNSLSRDKREVMCG